MNLNGRFWVKSLTTIKIKAYKVVLFKITNFERICLLMKGGRLFLCYLSNFLCSHEHSEDTKGMAVCVAFALLKLIRATYVVQWKGR